MTRRPLTTFVIQQREGWRVYTVIRAEMGRADDLFLREVSSKRTLTFWGGMLWARRQRRKLR